MEIESIVHRLQLKPHPEGGYFKETYRSPGSIPAGALPSGFSGDRNYCTAIYFLLQSGDFSAFHRIKSDECWHFYDGGTLLIHILHVNGAYQCIRLGRDINLGDTFQHVVPAGTWFASEPEENGTYALVGCTVAPGFDFADFEMGQKKFITRLFPQQQSLIERLCRI